MNAKCESILAKLRAIYPAYDFWFEPDADFLFSLFITVPLPQNPSGYRVLTLGMHLNFAIPTDELVSFIGTEIAHQVTIGQNKIVPKHSFTTN